MMLNAKTLARKGAAAAARRAIHSRRRVKNPIDLPRALVSNFPVKKTRPADKAVNGAAPEEEEPLYSAPVTSAHAIWKRAVPRCWTRPPSIPPRAASSTAGTASSTTTRPWAFPSSI